jgi:hypothetical protein
MRLDIPQKYNPEPLDDPINAPIGSNFAKTRAEGADL